MCRLVAYLGHTIMMDEVLVKPQNSIIMQSLHAMETDVRTNGDGFGLGWYAPQFSDKPGLFTSVFPAWGDRNLLNLTQKIESPCFFAHVRAASAGGVSTYNCHPFIHESWMLMHNGTVHNFIQIKRHLRHLLDDDIYNWIQGETDSEHIFALFLQLAKDRDLQQISVVAEVFQETLRQIASLIKQYGTPGPSYYNICLTDGNRLLASRYCSDKHCKPDSLHYLTESTLIKNVQRELKLLQVMKQYNPFVLIASERLSAFHKEWGDVPVNHLMLVENCCIRFVKVDA